MKHVVNVEFADFGWTALNESARRQGVTVEELVRHAAMVYLANDGDESLAHKVPAEPEVAGRAEAGA
jgi:hypothetical protein